ncbi:MAG: STAS domain-containing protein [Actinomycetota bacterium]|nr:STAS domain-containing protein [Actinomycetota bacterium]
MSRPHSAVLGHVPGTTSYRNTARFPEVETVPGIRVVRIDAAISFINSTHVKTLLLREAADIAAGPKALVLDASGIGDIDVTGVEMLRDLLADLDDLGVALHLADTKGPVRDVLWRAGLWDRFESRVHASTHDAVAAIGGQAPIDDCRTRGIDERAITPDGSKTANGSTPPLITDTGASA